MRAPLITAAALLAAVTGGSGCELAASNVLTRLVKVCTHDVPLSFQRASGTDTVATLPVDVSKTASYDVPDAVAVLHDLTLTRTSGDFSFADSFRVSVTAPGSGLPDADIATLQPVPPGPSLAATGDASINLAPYITAGAFTVRLDLHGASVPAQGVAVTLQACLDVDGVEISD